MRAAGNRLTASEQLLASALNPQVKTMNRVYSYDELYRLTGETINGTATAGAASYGYDPVGNRQSRSVAGLPLVPQVFTFDANDRLQTDRYDANGNTLYGAGFGQVQPDQYDFENHLVTRRTPTATINIVYDGDGNRVSKTVSTATNTVTTFYVVDELNPSGYAQVLEEHVSVNAQPPALNCRYTYGHNLISQTRRDGGLWATSYYGYDGHNNVRYLTDGNGAVTDTYDYDAFGNLTAASGATVNCYLFTGEQLDLDLGLYYLRARYHNPDTGRFWNMDSFEGNGSDPASLHKYTYCGNNPVNAYDPSGQMSTLAEVGIAAGIGATLSIGDLYFSSHGQATWDQYAVAGLSGAATGVLAYGGFSFLSWFGTGGKLAAASLGAAFSFAGVEDAIRQGNPELVFYRVATLGLFAIPGSKWLTRGYEEFYSPSRIYGLNRLRQERNILRLQGKVSDLKSRNISLAELEWGGRTEEILGLTRIDGHLGGGALQRKRT